MDDKAVREIIGQDGADGLIKAQGIRRAIAELDRQIHQAQVDYEAFCRQRECERHRQQRWCDHPSTTFCDECNVCGASVPMKAAKAKGD